jgi:hypothetical protein
MKAKEIPHSKPLEALKWVAVVVLIYLVSALIVFDFTSVAYAEEEDTYNGKEVAYGPRPRAFVVSPNPNLPGSYTGKEWPFTVYQPVCWLWRKVRGYERPGQKAA